MADKKISIDLLIQTAASVKSTEAQKSILLDIYEALKKVEKGTPAFDKLTAAANQLKTSLGGVNATFEDIYGDLKPLTSRMGELEDRMYEMALAGQQNTDEFKQLQAEAIKMRSTIIDVDASVDAFAQKGARLQAFVGIASGIAGGFSVAQGALALFGNESDAVEKSLLKVQSAIAVLNGLQEIQRLVTEKNIIVQKVLNFVMKQNPIMLGLTALITAATAAWAIYNKMTDKTAENEKKAAEEAEKRKEAIKRANEQIAKQSGMIAEESKSFLSMIGRLKETNAGTKERTELINTLNKTYGTHLQNLKDEDEFQKQVNASLEDYLTYSRLKVAIQVKEAAAVKEVEKQETIRANALKLNLGLSKQTIDELLSGSKKISDLPITDFTKSGVLARNEFEKLVGQFKNSRASVDEIYTDVLKLEKGMSKFSFTTKSTTSSIDDQKDKLEELADAYTKAANSLKDFNDEQSFEIKEDQLSLYQEGIDKILAIRKAEYEKEKALIEKTYNDELEAAKKLLEGKKSTDKDYLAAKKSYDDEVVRANNNKIEKQKLAEGKLNKDITDALDVELEKRRKLIIEYSKGLLNTDEFNRNLNYIKEQSKTIIDFNGGVLLEDALKLGPNTEQTIERLKIIDGQLNKIRQSTSVSPEETPRIPILTIPELIKTSIGESSSAMDLLNAVYEDKRIIIIDAVKKINDELKKEADKTGEIYKEFAIEPTGDQIGLKELENIKTISTEINNAVEALGNNLTDEYDKVKSNLDKIYSDNLFNMYSTYKAEIDAAGDNEKEKAKIREEYIKNTEKAQEDHNDAMIILDLAYGKASQEDLVEYFKKKNQTIENNAQKELEDKKKVNDELLNLERALQQAALDIYNNTIDMKLKANQKLYDQTIAQIDAEENAFNEQFITRTALEQAKYDAELSFQAKRDNAERKRQLEEDRLNKKRFNAEKINNITTATINTAVGVSAALKSPETAPFIIPLIITTGAVQIASIAAQKYIPQYAKGGLVTGPGSGTSDSIDAKLSNGEVVINAKSSKAFAPLLNAINQAGGGSPIPYTKSQENKLNNMSNQNVDLSELKDAIYSLADRPVQAYIKESVITNSQEKMSKIKNRTSF